MESTPSLVNWHDVNKLKRPGMHALSSLQAVAHGSDSVQYFQWRKSRGAHEKFHGAVVDHCGHEHTRVFREVQDLGDKLKKLAPVCGTCVEPDVAILCDWENRWAIEGMQGLKADRKYTDTCVKHYESFWKKGVPCDIIDMDQDFSSYKLIVAPMLYMLKPGTADRLKDFVKKGGQLVLTLNGDELPYTVAGREAGAAQIVGMALITTTAADSVLTVRNPAGSNPPLTLTPSAGGTEPVSAHLIILQLA
jgi:beta-galactosidase